MNKLTINLPLRQQPNTSSSSSTSSSSPNISSNSPSQQTTSTKPKKKKKKKYPEKQRRCPIKNCLFRNSNRKQRKEHFRTHGILESQLDDLLEYPPDEPIDMMIDEPDFKKRMQALFECPIDEAINRTKSHESKVPFMFSCYINGRLAELLLPAVRVGGDDEFDDEDEGEEEEDDDVFDDAEESVAKEFSEKCTI